MYHANTSQGNGRSGAEGSRSDFVTNIEKTASSVPTELLLSLEQAGHYRDGRWLVRGVDLKIHPEEILTLIGPNGSGKSTTIKMALGLMKLTEGTVARRPGLRIGYVPQKLTLDRTIPVTVDRFMRLNGHPPADKIAAALEQTGADHLVRSSMHNLSGGEFQRVILARAIATEPDLLVLDEPVQGVDFASEVALYSLIAELRNTLKCSILLISHHLHVVMAATDRVICLDGHVCCQGKPGEVVYDRKYIDLFGQHAADALAIYTHHHNV